jgi:serine/threonine protein kinase
MGLNIKMLSVNDIILDNEKNEFRLTRVIGHGQFGIVFEAEDRQGIKWAVKTIDFDDLDSKFLSTILNEGNNLSSLIDENVIFVKFFHNGTK